MITIEVIGGLGNQLFQYATGLSVAKKLNTELIVDISRAIKYDVHPLRLIELQCSSIFNPNRSVYEKIIKHRKLSKVNPFVYREKSITFSDDVFNVLNGTKIYGYFQSEMYFSDIREQLLTEFIPNKTTLIKNSKLIESIRRENSVSVHIRRGDYISDQNASVTHGICSQEYYIKAIDYLKKNHIINKDTYFYVFSDDISWCKENISYGENTIYIDGNEPELDLYLMSKCKYNIIANSTFSWWGAWLNNNLDKVVISPEKWFQNNRLSSNNIIPDSWVKV